MFRGSCIGLVMRTFTRDPKDLEKQVKKVAVAAEKALAMKSAVQPLFDRIDIVIPTDKRYKMSDCGQTAAALKEVLVNSRVHVSEIAEGDNNVAVLNAALKRQIASNIDFMIINSPSAAGYLTPETVLDLYDAWMAGAVVVGVVLPESPHPTLAKMGLVQNTLAGWDVQALVRVGGFDQMAALAPIGEENPNAGVEEIPVLLKLAKKEGLNGSFIAMVRPKGEFTRWQLPPEGTEDRAQHDKNHASKLERMQAHANTLSMDLHVLEDAVMPDYRYQ